MARHTMNDRGDAERLLDRRGVDSVEDIRRANGSRHRRIEHAGPADRLDLSATGSADRMATDIVALEQARGQLLAQLFQLEELIRGVRDDLGRGMTDGHGPIAANIRPMFRDRAHGPSGVVRALRNYHAELMDVIVVIDQTLDSYRQTDATAARRVSAAGGQNG